MRIVIDGTHLCDEAGHQGAGIEQYTWRMAYWLPRLAPEDFFFIVIPATATRVHLRALQEECRNIFFIRSFSFPFFGRHLFLPLRLWLARPNVAFFPAGQTPFFWKGKSVVTIHDVAIYDHPEWFPDQQDFSVEVVVPRSIREADHVIAVSHATKESLARLFPESREKCSVVHEGVEPPHELMEQEDLRTARFPFDRDFLFFLGTIEPRKNIVNAIQAFHAFLVGRPDFVKNIRFILAGKQGWNMQEIQSAAEQVNAAWNETEPNGVIQFLGPVTEQEKWNLLARASCLLFPSFDEGFGLPVLEAMSVGTPVITCARGALPEVGGEAVIYVEPEDIEQMSLAITQCLLVPEGVKHLRIEGFERARRFTWKQTAVETLRILKDIGSEKPSR